MELLTKLLHEMKSGLLLIMALTMVTGLAYPMVVTMLAQCFFPWRANGSLLVRHHQVVGSALIGQTFNQPGYFWGRPSTTQPYPYNSMNSGGTRIAPLDASYLAQVTARQERWQAACDQRTPAPMDLLTASASGLDPDISPAAAFFQATRVAKARALSLRQIENLIHQQIRNPDFGLLGESRVNVLLLNLALDLLAPLTPPAVFPLPAPAPVIPLILPASMDKLSQPPLQHKAP